MAKFIFILFIALLQLSGIEIKKAKVGDAELAYYMRGSGDPLVMIMGFRGTMAMWDPALLEELEKKYTLILFDNRGVGFSSDSSAPLTLTQMAKDTVELIQTLGFKKAHIFGWSMGALIAVEMALNHPDIVNCMILSAPNPGGNQVKRNPNVLKKVVEEKLTPAEGLALLFPETPAGQTAGFALIARLMDRVAAGKIPNDMNVNKQIIDRQVQALKTWAREHYVERLSQIKAPTLVAGGVDDVINPPENVQIVASQIPFAWSAYFPEAGHAFISQEYKNFSELVILFIESQRLK